METLHDVSHVYKPALHLLASPFRTLRCLSATDTRLWLVGASACETATPRDVVLFHDLSEFLLSKGKGSPRNG